MKNGPTRQRRIKIAGVRLIAFAAAWVTAFATLPTIAVAAAFVGRLAWIIPKVRWVNLEFQNIRDA